VRRPLGGGLVLDISERIEAASPHLFSAVGERPTGAPAAVRESAPHKLERPTSRSGRWAARHYQ
jgi:hypothetical protein